MEDDDRLRKLKWRALETHRLHYIVFSMNKLDIDNLILNLLSAIQPMLITHISYYMLSQQSLIHINKFLVLS